MDIVAERIFEEMSAAGTAHALPLNFRSVPEVCSWRTTQGLETGMPSRACASAVVVVAVRKQSSGLSAAVVLSTRQEGVSVSAVTLATMRVLSGCQEPSYPVRRGKPVLHPDDRRS